MSGLRWAEFAGKAAFVVALGSLGIFVAVRAAVARDGVTGSARTWVTVAGTLTGVPGDPRSVTMRFAFHRPGDATPLCAPTVRDVEVAVGGAFSARVPLDGAGATCPPDMLDGRDVQVDVDVGALSVVRNAEVNPVPYAHFATSAGTATRALQGPEVLHDTLDRGFMTSTDSALPNLRISLPRAGAYLLILNGSVFGGGDGNRGELNYVELVAGTQGIARRVIAGRGAEPSTTQRSSNITLITVFNARGPVDVTARVLFSYPSGTIQFGGDDNSLGTTTLVAIPIAATP